MPYRSALILWVCGAAATGKSVTAWHAFKAANASQALGYIDVDQVGMLYPDDEADECGYTLKNDAITAIARNFIEAGARRLLVSAVVDSREAGQADRLDRPDVRYLLLTVGDEVLRRRILERGWDNSDADEIITEQSKLRGLDFADAVIDTTGQTVAAVAERASAELTTAPPARGSHDEPKSMKLTPARSVFITGPRVVGCSTVGFGLARRSWSEGSRTGFADLEQLSFLRTPQTTDHTSTKLGLTNLATLASVFTRRGATLFVGNGHLRDQHQVADLRQHLTDVIVIRLRANADTLRSHILGRLGGNAARLTGDDLADAKATYQEEVLAKALSEQQQMDDIGIGDLVLDVDHADPNKIVEQITQFALG